MIAHFKHTIEELLLDLNTGSMLPVLRSIRMLAYAGVC
jgi:hypothetical protein